MSKLIRTEEELQSLMKDVRNRENTPNSMKIDLSDIWYKESFDWDNEYLDIIRVDDKLIGRYEVVYLKQYETE